MNFVKAYVIASLLTVLPFCQLYAAQVETLPTIKMMADSELRDEVLTTVQPFQQDHKVRKALQHQIIRREQDMQNFIIEEQLVGVNRPPITTLPDMSQLSTAQQQYVLAVASALQSSEPSTGIFKMLEPLGIDRDRALNGVRSGSLDINLDQQRLTQLMGDKWQSGLKGN